MAQQRTTFTARRPVDLVAVVPQVLGFHPEDSVVLLTFGPGESFHARVDLPTDAHEQVGVADLLVGVVVRHRIRRVAVLLYTDDPWTAASFHDAVLPRLVRRDVEVIDVLRVDRGRFHSACDPDDTGTPYDLQDHVFTAQQVLDGRVVHESRARLAASLVLVDATDARAVADAVRRLVEGTAGAGSDDTVYDRRQQARWVQRTVRRAVRTTSTLPVADAARLLVLVAEVDFRDVAWAEMERGTAARHVDLWRDLVRRSPESHRAAAASLLAFAAWLHGDGALAWCALDRCHEVDPHSTMAACVAGLLDGAVPPSAWTPIPEVDLPVLGSGPSGPPSLPPVC